MAKRLKRGFKFQILETFMQLVETKNFLKCSGDLQIHTAMHIFMLSTEIHFYVSEIVRNEHAAE